MTSLPRIAMLLAIAALVGCGPPQVEVIEEVKPNETAFVVAMEGEKGQQVRFDSATEVQKLQVAARRIEVPTRRQKIGRMPWDYKYIPTVRVITVDRTPITREWTGAGGNGHAAPIWVESSESITFSVAVTVTVAIEEQNAYRFLYWYGGKNLNTVVDENIRSLVAAEMAQRFGALTLNECRVRKGEVFKEIGEVVRANFQERGITVLTFGNVGGLVYQNPEIQKTMDEQFVSLNQLEIAKNLLEANNKKREDELAQAVNERRKAEEFARAQSASEARMKLEILRDAVARWQGDVPQFLMVGEGAVPMQFQLPMGGMIPGTPLAAAQREPG